MQCFQLEHSQNRSSLEVFKNNNDGEISKHLLNMNPFFSKNSEGSFFTVNDIPEGWERESGRERENGERETEICIIITALLL